MKDEKSATDHTLDVTLKRVDELHHQVEELKTQLLTKENRKNSSVNVVLGYLMTRLVKFNLISCDFRLPRTDQSEIRDPNWSKYFMFSALFGPRLEVFR